MDANAIELASEAQRLSLIGEATRFLASARSIEEVKEVRDQATAVRAYLRQRDASLEAQNHAAEIKLRAERRAGELLRGLEKNCGGRPPENPSHSERGLPPRISDLGIDHNESSRWQALATLPETDFERHIAATRAAGKELTTSGMVRLARQSMPSKQEASPQPKAPAFRPLAFILDKFHAFLRWAVPLLALADRPGLAAALRRVADELDAPAPTVSVHPARNGHTAPPTRAEAPRRFVYGSVCSGIEAATVAWQPLGWEPAWFAEVAEFPSAVLAHHYPGVPNHGDFTRIACEPGSIDLLVGGTPCQSFSVTGLRTGLDDDRGNLALEFLRLADRARPRWVVWENVPGVLSIDGRRAFASILRGLAELGYGGFWRVLDAQHFRVPQRRRRIFLVGYLGDWQPAAAVFLEWSSLSKLAQQGRPLWEKAPRGPGGDLPPPDRGRSAVFGWTGDETPKFGVNVMPTMRSQQGGEGYGIALPPDVVRRLTPLECERLLGFPDHYTRIPYRLGQTETVSPKPRLIALGNSMAVPCMRWIGERIQHVETIVSASGAR